MGKWQATVQIQKSTGTLSQYKPWPGMPPLISVQNAHSHSPQAKPHAKTTDSMTARKTARIDLKGIRYCVKIEYCILLKHTELTPFEPPQARRSSNSNGSIHPRRT